MLTIASAACECSSSGGLSSHGRIWDKRVTAASSTVGVAVGAGVAVGTGVAVGMGVGVAVGAAVGVCVAVAVGGTGVGVADGVGLGDGCTAAMRGTSVGVAWLAVPPQAVSRTAAAAAGMYTNRNDAM